MDQPYFEINPNGGGLLLRLFMGSGQQKFRQFPVVMTAITKPA